MRSPFHDSEHGDPYGVRSSGLEAKLTDGLQWLRQNSKVEDND